MKLRRLELNLAIAECNWAEVAAIMAREFKEPGIMEHFRSNGISVKVNSVRKKEPPYVCARIKGRDYRAERNDMYSLEAPFGLKAPEYFEIWIYDPKE